MVQLGQATPLLQSQVHLYREGSSSGTKVHVPFVSLGQHLLVYREQCTQI